MTHSKLQFDGGTPERDTSRLLPTTFLSPAECERLAQVVAARVRTHNPVQLLTGFAFPNLQLNSADSHSVFIEYLQHLILTQPPAEKPAEVEEDLVNELFAHVRNIFSAVSLSREAGGINDDLSQHGDLKRSLMLDALVIRGKSFIVHQLELLDRLLSGNDEWLRSHLHVGTSDILRTVQYLFGELTRKATVAIDEIQQVTACSERGSFGMVVGHDIFSLSPPDDGIAQVLQILAATPGSLPQPSSLLPGRAWATSRDFPILKVEGQFYCFNPQSVADELPRLVSEWIATKDKPFFDRHYVRRREGLLTDMALEALRRVLPGAVWGKNLYYMIDGTTRAETDGVVFYDDIAIVIEAKGGALSFSARQGSPARIKRDFGSLVHESFTQARRTADFIRDHPAGYFTDEHGNPELRLPNRGFRKVYLMTPVLDAMDAFAIELADARASGLLAPERDWPWCVFINDLKVVTDILNSPSVFLLYMDRRLRFNDHSQWFRVHDELDLLDYFLHRGLFLEKKPFKEHAIVQWQADSRELEEYYSAKASKTDLPPKPHPPFLPGITALVRSIENSHVQGRTALAMEIIGLGDASHRRMMEVLSVLPERLKQRHIPQSGTFIRGDVGLSIWFVETYTPDVQDRLRIEDACSKHDRKSAEWLSAIFVIGPEEPQLVEVLRNTQPWREDPEMDRTVQALRDAKFARRVAHASPGRNDRCPCGSGRKFKRCHAL